MYRLGRLVALVYIRQPLRHRGGAKLSDVGRATIAALETGKRKRVHPATRRRHDTIVAQLTSRIPAIEAPQEESTDAPESAAEEPERAEPHPNRVESPEAVQRSTGRSLWRRMFRVRG